MGLAIACDRCELPLEEPGALVFGPPDDSGKVRKWHVCLTCWRHVLEAPTPPPNPSETAKLVERLRAASKATSAFFVIISAREYATAADLIERAEGFDS